MCFLFFSFSFFKDPLHLTIGSTYFARHAIYSVLILKAIFSDTVAISFHNFNNIKNFSDSHRVRLINKQITAHEVSYFWSQPSCLEPHVLVKFCFFIFIYTSLSAEASQEKNLTLI